MVLVLVPVLIGIMWGIRPALPAVGGAQRPETPLDYPRLRIRPIVPIADLGVPAQQALAFARAWRPTT